MISQSPPQPETPSAQDKTIPRWQCPRLRAIPVSGAADGSEFILIGHSYGADHAIRVARYVKDHGMEVQLLFLRDATTPDPIPENVIHCIHDCETWFPGDLFPDIFSGDPVVADQASSRTQIMNLLFTREVLADFVGCADHFSNDANQLMHNLIITELFQLMAAHSDTAGGQAALATQYALPTELGMP